MWNKRWKFSKSYIVCIGLLLAGTMLQWGVGPIDVTYMVWPFNLIACFSFFLIAGILILAFRHTRVVCWLGSYYAALANLSGILLLTFIMGLVYQNPSFSHLDDFFSRLGISQMLTTWTFLIQMLWMCLILYTILIRRAICFSIRDTPFILNHLGLLVIVVGMLCSSADLQQDEITVRKGDLKELAINNVGDICKLPFAIKLNRFYIEYNSPKLMLIDSRSGEQMPKEHPQQLLIDSSFKEGMLGDWNITVQQNLLDAAEKGTNYSVKFIPSKSYGSTAALYLKAVNRKTHIMRSGWVSFGNFMFPDNSLNVDGFHRIVMAKPEPKRYISNITIYMESGLIRNAEIEVNKPYRIAGWDIYQLGFDEQKGKWSDISVFRLVYDPWLPVVYTGIILLTIGALWELVAFRKSKKQINKEECE
jgi:cytochrome c biogenesis factor